MMALNEVANFTVDKSVSIFHMFLIYCKLWIILKWFPFGNFGWIYSNSVYTKKQYFFQVCVL
jgi:hypothetical protein